MHLLFPKLGPKKLRQQARTYCTFHNFSSWYNFCSTSSLVRDQSNQFQFTSSSENIFSSSSSELIALILVLLLVLVHENITVQQPNASVLNLVCYVSLCEGLRAGAGSLSYIVHVDCCGLSTIVIKTIIIISQNVFLKLQYCDVVEMQNMYSVYSITESLIMYRKARTSIEAWCSSSGQ